MKYAIVVLKLTELGQQAFPGDAEDPRNDLALHLELSSKHIEEATVYATITDVTEDVKEGKAPSIQ